MGCHSAISHDKFPTQGEHLNMPVEVCFHFDSSKLIKGRVVRDDMEAPFETIIKLDDGRFVLAGECQYKIID